MADRYGTNPDRRSLAGAALFVAGTTFWLVNTIAEARYPGYNVGTQALSNLGAVGAPTQWLWNAGLVVLGVGWVLGMALLFRGTGRTPRLVLHLVPGIAVLGVALFPVGSVSLVHNAAALLTFVSGGLVAVGDSTLLRPPFRYFSIALGMITLLTVFPGSVLLGTVLGFGATERLVAYPIVAWTMAFGTYAMAGGLDRVPR
jgi:hypothetical membrane protein